jgi:hypothetical protein
MKKLFLLTIIIICTPLLLAGCSYKIIEDKTTDKSAIIESGTQNQQDQINTLKKELDDLKKQGLQQEDPSKLTETQTKELSSIISGWKNRTAFLTCSWLDSSTNTTQTQTATAYIGHSTSGKITAITNRHAVLTDNGNLVDSCVMSMPGNKNSIYISSSDINLHPDSSIDAARFFLDEKDSYLSSLTRKKICFQLPDIKVNIGDQVVILGYPGIGSQKDITATDGIISGYDYPYYVTSAKIDHGNSGGLAILVKGDCYLGVPSGSVVGSMESLGRILEASAIQSTAQNQ